MAAKSNGPAILPALEPPEDEGLLRRCLSCCGRKNAEMSGRVVPSNVVSLGNNCCTHTHTHSDGYIHLKVLCQ